MAIEQIQGSIKSIVFRNEENDWTVFWISFKGHAKLIRMVAHCNAQVGQQFVASGTFGPSKQSLPYKMQGYDDSIQFDAESITATNPTTVEGMISFLGCGMIKGIGKATAKLIVDQFGADTFDIFDNNMSALLDIKGIGQKKLATISKAWEEHRESSKIQAFLHSQNISPALCKRIYREYGKDSIEKIKADPYRLALEIRGVGFKTADRIAETLCVPKTSIHRTHALVIHLLTEASSSGHTFMYQVDLIEAFNDASIDCQQSEEFLISAFDAMAGQEKAPIVIKESGGMPCVILSWLDVMEKKIASRIQEWNDEPQKLPPDLDKVIAGIESEVKMQLTQRQKEACEMALRNRFCILTGGPGCGKTATLSVILRVFKHYKITVSVAAPTGKAAQRAKEATGLPASTLHRLFAIRPGTLPKALVTDALVVDESTMVDVPLMHSVLKAISERQRVLLVGDVDQLPSVGPGRVFGDLIDSGVVPVTRLDQIFRQAAGSLIITNAHAINKGAMPQNGGKGSDFVIFDESNTPSINAILTDTSIEKEDRPSLVAQAVRDLVRSLIANAPKLGYNPLRDVMVLAPMNTGACGVRELNRVIQEDLFAKKDVPKVQRYGMVYYLGDRVIQTSNNYDKNVFNGEIGFVTNIDSDENIVKVRFDEEREVDYEFDDLDELRLAYAMTIHKSQGSQAPLVIVPTITQHWMMLARNLIYTAVTRASKKVVIVGTKTAIRRAAQNTQSSERRTMLKNNLNTQSAHSPC